jgi:hypothetical protein
MTLVTEFNNFQQASNGTTVSAANSAGNSTNTNGSPEAGTSGDGANALDGTSVVSGGTLVYSSAQYMSSHGETLSCEVATGATAGVSEAYWTTSLASAGTFYVRGYFYFTANPSGNPARVFQFQYGSALNAGIIGVNTSGKIVLGNASLITEETFTTAISLNQWIRIEGYLTGSGSGAGVISASLYNSPESATATETHTITSQSTGGSPLTGVAFGQCNNVASTTAFYMTDVAVSSSGVLGPSQYSGAASAALTLAATSTGTPHFAAAARAGPPLAALIAADLI